MNGKKARAAQAKRAKRNRTGTLDVGGHWSRRFIRPIVPGEFGPEADDWIPRGATQVKVVQSRDPVGDVVLLEVRTALPPGGHGRGLCVVEACTPETARIAPHFLPSMAAMGAHITDEGSIHPMWAYLVDLP